MTDSVLWRLGQLYGALFSAAALLVLWNTVTEDSPYFLAQQGLYADARRVLGLLQGADRVDAAFREMMLDLQAAGAVTEKMGLVEALSLPDSRRAILVCFGIAILRQLCGIYVFALSGADLFGQILGPGFQAACYGALCPVMNFAVCLVMPLYIERVGRRTLLILGSGLGTAILAVALLCNMFANTSGSSTESGGQCICSAIKKDGKIADAGKTQLFMITACLAFVGCFATGFGGVAWVYFGEAPGPEYRDAVYAGASVINWLSAAFVVMTFEPLKRALGRHVYWVYVLCSGFACFFAATWVRETRGVPLGHAFAGHATAAEISVRYLRIARWI